MKIKFQIRILVIISLIIGFAYCKKQDDLKTFTCSGDCQNLKIEVTGESGEFHVEQSCQVDLEEGIIINSKCSGTRTYLNSGNSYQYTYEVNFKTCKYFITVEGLGTCGDKDYNIMPPILSTETLSSITSTSVQSGGTVTSDEGLTITESGVCWSIWPSPTINDNKTIDGNGNGNFTSLITGLNPNTTYYVRAYATSRAGTGYGNARLFCTQQGGGGTVSDIDGNVYHTVNIGGQIWIIENLKVSHYQNGDPIPNIVDSIDWGNLTTGAFCDYNNSPANSAIYGKLYNWYAIKDLRGISPSGWHVPSDTEWTVLTEYLGGEQIAGGKLKEVGTIHWLSPNTEANNEAGFTAIPGGNRYCDIMYSYRDTSGTFSSIGSDGFWWSSTESMAEFAWNSQINFNSGEFTRVINNQKEDGFSVRCLKD